MSQAANDNGEVDHREVAGSLFKTDYNDNKELEEIRAAVARCHEIARVAATNAYEQAARRAAAESRPLPTFVDIGTGFACLDEE